MSFLDFSMCPYGAFMMHESVTEYDPVAREIEDHRDLSMPMTNMVVSDDEVDPVAKIQDEFGKIYENDITKLLHISYAPATNEEAIETLDFISDMATRISDKFRKCIVTQYALLKYYNNLNIVYEESKKYIGELLKNVPYFKQQGYSQYNQPYTMSNIFRDGYTIRRFITVLNSYPDFIKENLSTSIMNLAFWDDTFSNSFEDTLDMIKCVYTDSERFNRLETHTNKNIQLDNLFSLDCNNFSAVCECGDLPENCQAEIIRIISITLRNICQNCYNMQCTIMDDVNINTNTLDIHFQEKLKEVITETLNIFIIGTVVTVTNAYLLRESKFNKSVITNYVNILVSVLKSKK